MNKLYRKYLFILEKIYEGITFFALRKNKRIHIWRKQRFERSLKATYGDQKGQVRFLVNNVLNYEKNGLVRGGFFVDLACADGVYLNNTLFLEQHLQWSGILFEPNYKYHAQIKSCRTSKLVTACVSDQVGKLTKFRVDNGMLGGIVSEQTDNARVFRSKGLTSAEIVEIPTTTLEVELDKAQAPSVIDFMSLDIEGAEWLALKDFNFEKYIFRCMCIERPSQKLDLLLDRVGYRQVAHLDYDVVYVHESFIDNMNLSPAIDFMFTESKDW
jgi:FkbM family methyltransferase